MTIFHRPKQTGLPHGLRLAGKAVRQAKREKRPLDDVLQEIIARKKLDDDQAKELRRLARERQERGL